jgi:hypothetical protein
MFVVSMLWMADHTQEIAECQWMPIQQYISSITNPMNLRIAQYVQSGHHGDMKAREFDSVVYKGMYVVVMMFGSLRRTQIYALPE